MPHKLYKILLIFTIVAILVAIPAFWLTFSAATNLEVAFLDIGQGDSILIKTPFGQNILIDGGPDDTVIKRLSENLAWWDKTIDLMILTHPHDDHVTGLIDVINRYKVERILYTGVVHDSPNYLFWLEKVRDRKISLTIIDRPQTIQLGENCQLEFIYPRQSLLGKAVNNLNNSSIVAELVYGQTKFLLAGDIELEVEQVLTQLNPPLNPLPRGDFLGGEYKGVDLTAQVLKANHHGSDTSNIQEFLEAVKPEVVVIQVGADNDFGHPSRRVIKRLERIGAKILRNDVDGTVRLISDGQKISIIEN